MAAGFPYSFCKPPVPTNTALHLFRPASAPVTVSSPSLHGPPVKITVSHERTIAEVKQAIDRSLDEVFTGSTAIPVKLAQEQRAWQGDTMIFSFVAKMGFVSTPISGTVHVTDHDLTIDANLGFFERLIPAAKAHEAVSSRVKALLK